MELLSAAEMRAVEGRAIAVGEVTGLELMERAGGGVVEALLARWPRFVEGPHRAAVLAGPGNNGGDGFVVARHLRERGWRVAVFLYGEEARLPRDAAENARRWREGGGEVLPVSPGDTHEKVEDDIRALRAADLLVDALFGTGLGRPVAPLRAAVTAVAGQGGPAVVAVDIPSGLCADSGREIGEGDAHMVLPADLTVTFHRPKRGHYLARGPALSGEVRVVDIGLGEGAPEEGPEPVRLVAPPGRELAKAADAHKYDHGHALILSGPSGRGGAARMAARGALRAGAGLVTVGCPPDAVVENAARLDAIMLRPVADAEAFRGLDIRARLSAVGLGFGFGGGERARAMVAEVCGAGLAAVLDADALTSFEDDPEALFGHLHERCVLTPHPGEFRRIFPDIADRLSAPAASGPAVSRIDAAREAAARAGAVVLLKGPDTVIAHPSGRASVSAAAYGRSVPWLATAGAGDVLAGMIAGLLARGLAPVAAAEAAAWLHVEAARRFGPGLVAEDLPETLPAIYRDLGL